MRAEFTKATKRLAYERSEGRCEAVGLWYGLPEERRCPSRLERTGVEYDHIVLEANSHDNSLENCAAVCPSCHRWKSANRDTPTAAKTVRMQDKARNITGRKYRWPSRPFPKRQVVRG